MKFRAVVGRAWGTGPPTRNPWISTISGGGFGAPPTTPGSQDIRTIP